MSSVIAEMRRSCVLFVKNEIASTYRSAASSWTALCCHVQVTFTSQEKLLVFQYSITK
jgi:hypothetical protein